MLWRQLPSTLRRETISSTAAALLYSMLCLSISCIKLKYLCIDSYLDIPLDCSRHTLDSRSICHWLYILLINYRLMYSHLVDLQAYCDWIYTSIWDRRRSVNVIDIIAFPVQVLDDLKTMPSSLSLLFLSLSCFQMLVSAYEPPKEVPGGWPGGVSQNIHTCDAS